MKTLAEISTALANGKVTSEKLTQDCLAQITNKNGEGERAFIKVCADSALATARASDALRAHGIVASPIAGIPISIKDLFDVQGDVTRAGSIVLRDAPPATRDAPAIARLRAAGAVIIGRTNMTEFAYGAHGINAHYGTPLNPWDRTSKRIPGGSTSGGAVSVTDGMAMAAIGSDTGGSVRIPSALCGITGFKPTQARVPLEGAFPLSTTRDSIGPLGHSAQCCIWLDQIMAGEPASMPEQPSPNSLKGLRFGIPQSVVLNGLAPEVANAFQRALTTLSKHGALIEDTPFTVLADEAAGNARANFSAVEAYALHRERLAKHADQFDPNVRKRLLLGADMKAADYYDLLQLRLRLFAKANAQSARFDALLLPTVPIIAPTFAEMQSGDEAFFRNNSLLLRNCAPFNGFNRPCWSLPCHREGDAPVGLMIVGETDQDRRLHGIGLAVEAGLKF
jgi:aspartyl-tRNA(Asn)/glutamyl-tRNA(Gln) amidotransferase subunit A